MSQRIAASQAHIKRTISNTRVQRTISNTRVQRAMVMIGAIGAVLAAGMLPHGTAMAQTATGDPAPGGLLSSLGLFAPMLLVFGVFYMLMIRPQQKRMKEHRAKVAGAQRGDRVLTGGGFLGTVVGRNADHLKVRLAPNVEVEVLASTLADVYGPSEPTDDEPTDRRDKKGKKSREGSKHRDQTPAAITDDADDASSDTTDTTNNTTTDATDDEKVKS